MARLDALIAIVVAYLKKMIPAVGWTSAKGVLWHVYERAANANYHYTMNVCTFMQHQVGYEPASKPDESDAAYLKQKRLPNRAKC